MTSGAVDLVGQIPHWLFAFDAAGSAVLRTLALLATHPAHHLGRATMDSADPAAALMRPFLRSCVLDSLRLWPTTPMILRDTTEDTEWGSGSGRFTVEKGAAVMIATPAFHRDDQLLPFAHEFVPGIWLDGQAQLYPQLAPFSAGPAECPGRNLVLFVTSSVLANLLSRLEFQLSSKPRLSPSEPLPMTLSQLTLDFSVRRVSQQAPSTALH